MSATPKRYWIAVFQHDGDTGREGGPQGPFVFESYLNESTRENAAARMSCEGAKCCGSARLAWLDFDSVGDESAPHVVVANFDGVNRDRGPLVWETLLSSKHATRSGAMLSAGRLEYRYGACRVALVVFDDEQAAEASTITTTSGETVDLRKPWPTPEGMK